MKIDKSLLKLLKAHDYLTHFKPDNLNGLIMWIVDAQDRVVDATPTVLGYFHLDAEDFIGKTIRELHPDDAEKYLIENQRVRNVGQPATTIDWMNLPIGWRKIALTKFPLGDGYIIGIGHDVTDADPMAGWLQRLDLARGRLGLGPRYRAEYITLAEYLVLHRLSRNHSYQEIATELNISPQTVKYRLSRIKEKLNVLTSQEMWEEIYASGLIHLLALPLSLDVLSDDDLNTFSFIEARDR